MKSWNPFGKVDMEIGSFIKTSPFNKEYVSENVENRDNTKVENTTNDK